MPDTELSSHAKDMPAERRIPEEWVWRTIRAPDREEIGADSDLHYLKPIAENAGRILRVVVNAGVKPRRVLTVFFDRRLRRK
jgi:hypothetical protein